MSYSEADKDTIIKRQPQLINQLTKQRDQVQDRDEAIQERDQAIQEQDEALEQLHRLELAGCHKCTPRATRELKLLQSETRYENLLAQIRMHIDEQEAARVLQIVPNDEPDDVPMPPPPANTPANSFQFPIKTKAQLPR
ncbi:uncharacterized protein LOC118456391 isoform X1 [Anopheles albimanus]|uniref:uncharacterized protein LOC118456391 isoform X1 n=1 Tax=Anopheles albimanus TaxID=7167 RepID=UPI00163E211D|nr:uncharacterized protein LOC118456391 isoform X1 [Anopheles albimanus]